MGLLFSWIELVQPVIVYAKLNSVCIQTVYVVGTLIISTTTNNRVKHGLVGLNNSRLSQQEVIESTCNSSVGFYIVYFFGSCRRYSPPG
jgi:hypothetical protein